MMVMIIMMIPFILLEFPNQGENGETVWEVMILWK